MQADNFNGHLTWNGRLPTLLPDLWGEGDLSCEHFVQETQEMELHSMCILEASGDLY